MFEDLTDPERRRGAIGTPFSDFFASERDPDLIVGEIETMTTVLIVLATVSLILGLSATLHVLSGRAPREDALVEIVVALFGPLALAVLAYVLRKTQSRVCAVLVFLLVATGAVRTWGVTWLWILVALRALHLSFLYRRSRSAASSSGESSLPSSPDS